MIGGGRLATALLGLVSIRIATNLLTPEQYGVLSLLVAVQLFCGMFLINPVEQHIYRHAHAWWDSRTLWARLSSYKSYSWIVSGIGAVFVIGTSHPQSLEESLLIGLTMFFMVVAVTWNGITVPMLNMLGFRAESIFWSVLTTGLSVLSSILLVTWNNTAIAWFAGQAVGMALGALGAGLSLWHKGVAANHATEKLDLIDKKTVTTYCIPLAIATGLMWLQLSGYRFAVEHFWGLAALGYIAVGFVLSSQIWGMFESLATQLLYPAFYRHITGSNTKQNEIVLSDLLNILGPMSFVLAGITVLSAPALLYALVDQQYHSAGIFIFFGVVIECCRVLSNLLSRAAHITRRTRSLALPYAIGGGAQLIFLCIAGWQQVNVIWVGFGLVAGAVIMLMIMAVNMYREVHYELDMRRWLLAGGVLAFFAMVGIWLPAPTSIWQALCVLCVVGVSGAGLMYLLAWKNPATGRLLGVELRGV